MGMVINGQWSDEDQILKDGAYVRQQSRFDQPLTNEQITTIKNNPGRFHLLASYSCPWSHRAMIMRLLNGLESLIPLTMIGGKRVQGYPIANGDSWTIPGTTKEIVHLHELYTLSDEQYTGRSTVPVLWDSETKKIICNESVALMRALGDLSFAPDSDTVDWTPATLLADIDSWNDDIYQHFSNGVYRAGFSDSQEARHQAVIDIETLLQKAEAHLATNRYLSGDVLTEADWRFFPTLIRFDTCYYSLFKCSSRPLTGWPTLFAYTRELYNISRIRQSVNFDVMYQACFDNDVHDHEDLPKTRPEISWSLPHNRDFVGTGNVMLKDGTTRQVEEWLNSLTENERK